MVADLDPDDRRHGASCPRSPDHLVPQRQRGDRRAPAVPHRRPCGSCCRTSAGSRPRSSCRPASLESTSSGPTAARPRRTARVEQGAYTPGRASVTGTPTAAATESNASGTPSMFQSIAARRGRRRRRRHGARERGCRGRGRWSGRYPCQPRRSPARRAGRPRCIAERTSRSAPSATAAGRWSSTRRMARMAGDATASVVAPAGDRLDGVDERVEPGRRRDRRRHASPSPPGRAGRAEAAARRPTPTPCGRSDRSARTCASTSDPVPEVVGMAITGGPAGSALAPRA